ncbi:MAG: Na+/H+ antiporter NhaA [Microlunatus sp.]|nr:Na+/H+ antiporter NhaA [Microlunatus sp.]
MLSATLVALVWANVPGGSYEKLWSLPISIKVGGLGGTFTLHGFLNEGLMTLFFFLVGLEVKHELAVGELTNRARALLPIAAAVAGLFVPAIIYVLFNLSSGEAHGWGVVISTDTAFLLGAVALIAPKHPSRLRTFLLALAVVDDIGALLVIGLFYSSAIAVLPLVAAVVVVVLLALVRFLRTGRGVAYALLGVVLWAFVLAAGIHPTLTGVAVALVIPVFPPKRVHVERAAELSQAFRESPNPRYAAAVARSMRESLSINARIDAAWRPYIAYGVLPLFALANAGVHVDGKMFLEALASPVARGIVAGLVIGKFIGITGATALLRALRRGQLAPGLGMTRIAGGAVLSGIGFTISLFLVPIAINDRHNQDLARIAVLSASVLAFLCGWLVLMIGDRIRPPKAVGAVLARPVDPERDHIVGRFDAPYSIVEYGDFECPFCSRATGSVDAVRAHFGDDIRWVWRHLPLDQVHPHAQVAAQAAEAAALQGKFVEMLRTMFAHQQSLEEADLIGYAEELGLDLARFAEDFGSSEVLAHIQDDRFDAELMDLHSTPTFFVNGRRHTGPYDSGTLIRALEAAVARRPDPTNS